MDVLDSTTATATGDGRNGRTETEDGLLTVDVRMPPELGGPGGATNPEQLFAAGYAACFQSALKLLGGQEGADLRGSAVSVTVGLGLAGSGFGLTAALDVHAPALDRETALALVKRAHEVCPYSQARRGNVEVALDVVD